MALQKGFSVLSAAVFITSFMVGMGVVALPRSLAGTGWYGLILTVVACFDTYYSSTILGSMWMTLEDRWEEYRGKFRYPYPAIGQRAVGPSMRFVVTIALHISLLGIAIVYLLLSAQIAQSLTENLFTMDYKYWIIILAAVLCPLSWFGSIEEFWFAAVGALASAACACIVLLICILLEIPEMVDVSYGDVNISTISLSFGTIIFSYGAAYIFPTIQNDMANKEQFNKATIMGFIGLTSLYLPVSIAGYAVFGSRVPANVILALGDGKLKTTVEICMGLHVFLAFLIAMNPVAQEYEEVFHIKKDFNYGRVLLRSAIVGFALLIAYAIPHFDKVLNLVGGSAMPLLSFILPPIFYILLNREDPETKYKIRKIPWFEKVFLFQIVLLGIVGAISCTYFAVVDIIKVFTDELNPTNSTVQMSLH